MKNGIKFLYGILIIGILISILQIAISGDSSIENLIDNLILTSIILFISSIVFTLLSFKKHIRKTSLWILIIISSPLAIMSMTHFAKEIYLKFINTTTPDEFAYGVEVDRVKYEKDKIILQNLVDSLIKVQTIQRPSKLALRYFNGISYYDSLERDWAIDLPSKIDYKQSIIDTLFYSPDGKKVIAGLLINKVFNNYSNKIEFFGKGFKYVDSEWKPIKILKYSVTGHYEFSSCSESLRYLYLKKIFSY